MRIGQNGIVPDTEIVIEAEIPGLTPKEAIDIADEYLRTPISEIPGEYVIGRYEKSMYRDHWMKKVVVSTIPYGFIEEGRKLPISKTYNENEELYEILFYFGGLRVYVSKEGDVVAISSAPSPL